MAMHIEFRVFWFVWGVVLWTLLLYNSIIGIYFYYCFLTHSVTNMNIVLVYCHELAPMLPL